MKSVIERSRLTGRAKPKGSSLPSALFTRRAARKRSLDFATKARLIATSPEGSDLEKLQSLATLSADYAADATDPQEKEAYTRLNANFLQEAGLHANETGLSANPAGIVEQSVGESAVRQAAHIDSLGD